MSKWNEPLGEFHFDPKVTTHEAGVMFARGLRGGTERSAVETRSPLANITTAEWGVTFGSNGKILEMRPHSFGFNVIVSECLPIN